MSTDQKDDEKTATVIPWRGAKPATPAPEAAASPPVDGAAAPPPGASAPPPGPDDMTLDEFEAAIRRALAEKLVDPAEPQFPPRGADDLVAKVFSALSGKDAKQALAEVRERMAGGPEPVPGEVIDLAAAREARKKTATETQSRLSGALKDTFNDFMANLSASQGNRTEITLDSRFLKEHGPSLLGNLFQGIASALLQGPKTADAAAPKPAPASDETAPASPPAPGEQAPATPKEPVQVNVKVDFASILGGLFRRAAPTPPAPTPPSPPAPEPGKDEPDPS